MMRTAFILLATLSCAGCGVSPAQKDSSPESAIEFSAGTQKSSGPAAAVSPDNYRACMREIAASADETVMDGWFYGQDPRFFKSFYRKVSPELKADFAVDYHEWLKQFGQDLVRDMKSYVPYSKRADFAMNWWAEKVERFKTEPLKMQVLWAHESIQDAGELWWRACEKIQPEAIRSDENLAHDEEQRMIAAFMDRENSPGQISDQIWKREHSQK